MIGYGDRARTQCEVVRLFRETHPDLPPLNQGTISKIEAQYREMGNVRKVPSKRQAVVDDDTKLNLLLALEENPITPARQLARDRVDIDWTKVKEVMVSKDDVTHISVKSSHLADKYDTLSLKRNALVITTQPIPKLNNAAIKLSADKYKDLVYLCTGPTPVGCLF
ncbi:hypothetical protein NQ318_013230 [Aromia moschata]|uniref:DUF4817 domain-containing protein n=1 Tax=Aromia moschata TaxID=1265417 RepID=A0AAV8YB67_9CUCU|nr:hypothetical protein NQ318_013230 [Aromia moschata]